MPMRRACKTPRRPLFKKRAAADAHQERVINSIFQRMPDRGLKRMREEAKRDECCESVQKKIRKTRANEKWLNENPQMIRTIGEEHLLERKYSIFFIQTFYFLLKITFNLRTNAHYAASDSNTSNQSNSTKPTNGFWRSFKPRIRSIAAVLQRRRPIQ